MTDQTFGGSAVELDETQLDEVVGAGDPVGKMPSKGTVPPPPVKISHTPPPGMATPTTGGGIPNLGTKPEPKKTDSSAASAPVLKGGSKAGG